MSKSWNRGGIEQKGAASYAIRRRNAAAKRRDKARLPRLKNA
jgi:hypothetical protein